MKSKTSFFDRHKLLSRKERKGLKRALQKESIEWQVGIFSAEETVLLNPTKISKIRRFVNNAI